MAEHPQNRDAQAQATSASQIRPNENTSERTAWRPLRLPMFRNLLIADLVSDIGTFMQGVGAAWLLVRSEEHTSELQSRLHLVCRLLLEKKKKTYRALVCMQYTD